MGYKGQSPVKYNHQEIWSPLLLELGSCPEIAEDLNENLFFGKYAHKLSLSLRI